VSPAAAGLDLSSGAGIGDHPAAYAVRLAQLPAKAWHALRHQGQGGPTRKPADAATGTYLATADAAQRRRGKPR
jgi:hypothetical protein